MGEFKNTIQKEVIRTQWCKSLIRFVHEKLKYNLIYLGLPGPQALDLLEWIDYIDQVIAFQCRDYPNPSSINQSREKVLDLEVKLADFERQGKLTTFSLYDGYIEEVVLRGRDTNGNYFGQNNVVTIYNLDFCNSITVPLEVKDDKGNIQKCYKSDAIRRLLEIQRNISSQTRGKKFIMFLTVHSCFWEEEAEKFVSQTESEPLKEYFLKINSLHGTSKRIRLLKAYIFDTVKKYFCNYDFTPEFLPVINYEGAGLDRRNWLLLFTIVGAENKGISGAPCFQNSGTFLNQKFLTVRNRTVTISLDQVGITEVNGFQNSVEAFKDSECYKKLWSER
jgi:hypothetical protein